MADRYDRMFQLIMGAWGSQVVRTLAVLDVAEQLADGPRTADEIARGGSADAVMTYRVLRAAVALGILTYDESTTRFAGTDLLRLLHRDAGVTLKHYAQASPGPVFWGPALRMPETVVRGRNHVAETLGCEVFEYFGAHPEDAALFSAAMTDLSAPVIDDAVAVIEAAEGHVVDVGGAYGAFLAALLKQRPALTGTVLELPHVASGVGDGLHATPGDFFDSVPAGDVYLLKHILHDWDDTACVRILTNIRHAMRPGARVYVVEMLMTASEPSLSAALTDMAMLFATTGRERELREYEALLIAAGLELRRVTPVHHPYAVIEAAAPA